MIVARGAVLPLPHVAAVNIVMELVSEKPYAVVRDRGRARTGEQASKRKTEDHATRPDQIPDSYRKKPAIIA